ncbi:MAG: metallophosphatase domain-containing protein [Chitinophagaceae bacterium]|nr:metallophosphatase domain-containing protein [Chitinophagaceae bacterium]
MPAITFISDTHTLHRELRLSGGDILIHCGDVTEYGTKEELKDFLDWFSGQPFSHKIFIAGNHDLCLEEMSRREKNKIIPGNITYLQNEAVTINGINIYGSPVSPYFLGMAFNRKRGKEIQKEWNKIPANTDILITHTPPFGIMDNGFGCEDLLAAVNEMKPGLSVFGHVHEQNGMIQEGGTTFINATLVNTLAGINEVNYRVISKPVEINMNL